MFVIHNAPIEKVVRCSYIITPLYERLLGVRISQRYYREGSQMFAYHNATIERLLDVRV
jgi:hypothetical protein